jgi:F-type H+-transporting ATPase subunit b
MTPIPEFLAAAAPHAEAEGGGVVSDIAATFKVHWPYFISQCVSFLIVAALLAKFAFGPVQRMLEQRRRRIADGEEKIKRIEQQLADSERRTAEAIAKANDEARRLIDEAKQSAVALTEQKSREAIGHAQQILAKAELAAKAEREQMAAELRKEFGRLVATTTARVTGKVLNDDDHRRINQEALAKIES